VGYAKMAQYMELRKYQVDLVEKARNEIRKGNKKIIIYSPTGSGKTIVAADIVRSAIEKGKKVLFLVHFRQLAFQARERFEEFGISDNVGMIMAGEDSSLGCPCQVAMVQTYSRRLKLDEKEFNPWFVDADLIIYDEAHASIAQTRKAILEMYSDDKVVLGLTATPCRADGRGLGEIYDVIINGVDIAELTDQKYLVPFIYYGAQELPDLENIPTVAGDYSKKVLGERVDKPKLIGDIYDNWVRICPERQTVIFCVNVKHSKHVRDLFQKRGVSIEHVDARSTEEHREDVLRRFKNGDLQVVTNCNVYSEGADFPWASCIIIAKPTKSLARYFQMGGRGSRTHPGKEDCKIIDHAGNVNRHGFLDDPVYWTLDGKEKAWKKKKLRKKETSIFTCKECGFQFEARRICPQCGFPVGDYGKKIETTDDELKRLKGNKKELSRQDKMRWWQMLEYERRRLGKSDKWLLANYKTKTGVWPRNMEGLRPIEPDDVVKRWFVSQRIRYAKRKQKEQREATV
jgi:DNA repair protein RadD